MDRVRKKDPCPTLIRSPKHIVGFMVLVLLLRCAILCLSLSTVIESISSFSCVLRSFLCFAFPLRSYTRSTCIFCRFPNEGVDHGAAVQPVDEVEGGAHVYDATDGQKSVRKETRAEDEVGD